MAAFRNLYVLWDIGLQIARQISDIMAKSNF